MQKKLLFNNKRLTITIQRLCAELIEHKKEFANVVCIGLQPRGIFLAQRLVNVLSKLGYSLPLGAIDVTFHRDDFQQRVPLPAYHTALNFSLEDKDVCLVDDVLYTGRTVRAALDALHVYGRPRSVELVVLIDRIRQRALPIEAQYVGMKVHTFEHQHIVLSLVEQSKKSDAIWLMSEK